MGSIHRLLATLLLFVPLACSSSSDEGGSAGSVGSAGSAGSGGQPQSACGNGKTDADEACDDGAANGTPGHCKADCSGMPAKVSISGDVLAFMAEVKGKRVEGAQISILEHPEMTVTTGADAHFQFDNLDEGSEVTLVMEHADYKTTQTATIKLGPHGVDPFTIQVVPNTLFAALSSLMPPLELDKYCVLTTTVTRISGSLFAYARQGEEGAKLTVTPSLPADNGPIYFNENVIPDKKLTATSKDGGALYIKVPPGEYAVSATKENVTFSTVKLKCRAGIIVNAGPSLGVQASAKAPDYAGYKSLTEDAYTATADSICDRTAECVNALTPAEVHYPAATVQSCKHMYRNTLSWLDASCDAQAHVRDAWKAFFDCKLASCDTMLHSDDNCQTEESAFNAAAAQYAPCYTAKVKQ